MSTAAEREQAERLVAKFAKDGGTIQKIPVGATRDQWRSGHSGVMLDEALSIERQRLFSAFDEAPSPCDEVAEQLGAMNLARGGLRTVNYGGAIEDDYSEESFS